MAARRQDTTPAAPVQLGSPYTTLAYAADPMGGVAPLVGYPSQYPHVLNRPVPFDYSQIYGGIGGVSPESMTLALALQQQMLGALQGGRGAGAGAGGQRAAAPAKAAPPTAPVAPALVPSHVPFQPSVQSPVMDPSEAAALISAAAVPAKPPTRAAVPAPVTLPAWAAVQGMGGLRETAAPQAPPPAVPAQLPAQLPVWAGMYDPSLATTPGMDIPIEDILAAFQTPPSTALGAQSPLTRGEPVTSAAQLGTTQLMNLMQRGASPTATPLEQAQAQWARAMLTSPQRATALPSVMQQTRPAPQSATMPVTYDPQVANLIAMLQQAGVHGEELLARDLVESIRYLQGLPSERWEDKVQRSWNAGRR